MEGEVLSQKEEMQDDVLSQMEEMHDEQMQEMHDEQMISHGVTDEVLSQMEEMQDEAILQMKEMYNEETTFRVRDALTVDSVVSCLDIAESIAKMLPVVGDFVEGACGTIKNIIEAAEVRVPS